MSLLLLSFYTFFLSPLNRAVRAVSWGEGNKHFATAADPFTTRDCGFIHIYEFPSEYSQAGKESSQKDVVALLPIVDIRVDDLNKATCLGWTIANRHAIAGFDNGFVIKYDSESGKEVCRKKLHDLRVNRLTFSEDKTMLITASVDTTAKLIDPETLDVLQIFKTSAPVNGAVISPIHPHVLIGGGQDAMTVTTTSASQGKFETRFFHYMYNEEFGRVKGHFGPINALAMHPKGTAYASGSEDGYIRLHHFDQNYLNCDDHIPDDLKNED